MFRSHRILAFATGACILSGAALAGHPGLSQKPASAQPAQHLEAAAHRTGQFAGVKANTGYATHETRDGKSILTLSDDFKVPETPAPHWQVVDSKGNAYLLQRLVIKGDKFNKTIEVPAYVPDIAKVQIWCAYAEVLLGEASFPAPVQ